MDLLAVVLHPIQRREPVPKVYCRVCVECGTFRAVQLPCAVVATPNAMSCVWFNTLAPMGHTNNGYYFHYNTLIVRVPVNVIGPLFTDCFTLVAFVKEIEFSGSRI